MPIETILAVLLLVVVAVAMILFGRFVSGAGSSLASGIAAARSRYQAPTETLAKVDAARDVAATLTATTRSADEELTVWLDLLVVKGGGLLQSSDWTLSVALTIESGGATTRQQVTVSYDGEDVSVSPAQYGVSALPSRDPERGAETVRIATLPAAPPGTPVRVVGTITMHTPVERSRFALSIAAGPAPQN